MILAEPIERLIRMLTESGLPGVAADLREYLEEGVLTGEGQHVPLDGLYRDVEVTRRRRSAEEQVRDSIIFIRDQVVQPPLLIVEAEHLAATLSEGPSTRRAIYLIDMRFEDAVPFSAVTGEELEAAKRLSELLPMVEKMLLEEGGLRSGE